MNKLSILRDACGLTLMGAGRKNLDFSVWEDHEKKKNPNNKAAAYFPSGVFPLYQTS